MEIPQLFPLYSTGKLLAGSRLSLGAPLITASIALGLVVAVMLIYYSVPLDEDLINLILYILIKLVV